MSSAEQDHIQFSPSCAGFLNVTHETRGETRIHIISVLNLGPLSLLDIMFFVWIEYVYFQITCENPPFQNSLWMWNNNNFLYRNVHSRSAAKVTIATMREQGGFPAPFCHFVYIKQLLKKTLKRPNFPSGISRALLHNFAGKPSVAVDGVKAGYFFSFPPAVCRNQQVGMNSHFTWLWSFWKESWCILQAIISLSHLLISLAQSIMWLGVA